MNLSVTIIAIAFLLNLTNAISIPQQKEGEHCKLSTTNATGICTAFPLCKHASGLFQGGKSPEICGFSGSVPRVCCPLPTGTLSRIMCAHYANHHNYVLEINFGRRTKPKEIPHMAAVGFDANDFHIVWLCGGSLISLRFVLTAAHCVESPQYGPAKWVRREDLDFRNSYGLERIEKVYVHPQYRKSSVYHDIALFKLNDTVSFTYDKKPACLHTSKTIPVNTLQATGWGKQGWLGDPSSHLMKVNLKVINHKKCAKRYASSRRLRNGILENFQICAGDVSGGDTCPGDSGGPLHFLLGDENVKPHYVIAGITSFGKGCGGRNSAGVYTRVSAYVGWIESIVWAEEKHDIQDYLLSFVMYN